MEIRVCKYYNSIFEKKSYYFIQYDIFVQFCSLTKSVEPEKIYCYIFKSIYDPIRLIQ